MALERTLLIIKPDAVKAKKIGRIIEMVEDAGFQIVDIKMLRWTKEEASEFYAVHREKPFFDGLVEFMTSGAIVALLLERENAIVTLRKLVGATDPTKAEPCTIRALYGTDTRRNAVHASDSPESAEFEINLLFGKR